MTEINGSCDARFTAVSDALASNFDRGLDVGASVCVTIDGEPVVDIWGGTIDAAGQIPWERDTITNVWSTTKTMTNLCALLLADHGELDLHAPVARYWPEFAAGGKEGVEVRHLLGHTAGLSGWTEPMEPEDLYDWEKATDRCSPPRSRGGSRAPRPATTRSRRATSSARSCAASPARRSGRSSPRSSPDRAAPTSTSASHPSTTRASPR